MALHKRVRIGIKVNLIVDDIERFKKVIASEYDCYKEEIPDDIIEDYINKHIVAHNKCGDVFLVEGGETDGWLVQELDLKELKEY